jgi:hypothetical protein
MWRLYLDVVTVLVLGGVLYVVISLINSVPSNLICLHAVIAFASAMVVYGTIFLIALLLIGVLWRIFKRLK